MKKKAINIICIIALALVSFSCHFVDANNMPATTTIYKNVRYVANMISSSTWGNPVISYTDVNGGTLQIQQMNLDVTLQLSVGLTATLTASCDGIYSPAYTRASAAANLKIYVNDSLKAQANDFKTDSTTSVTASANCSYTVK